MVNGLGCCFGNAFACKHPMDSESECGSENIIYKFKEEKQREEIMSKTEFKEGDRVDLTDYSQSKIISKDHFFDGGWPIGHKSEKLTVMETDLVLPTDIKCSFQHDKEMNNIMLKGENGRIIFTHTKFLKSLEKYYKSERELLQWLGSNATIDTNGRFKFFIGAMQFNFSLKTVKNMASKRVEYPERAIQCFIR